MFLVKEVVKVILAGIVSIVTISALLCFYNFLPVHEVNKRGNTDYVWPANSIWIKATEGISFGRFDSNGFNNKVVVDKPDIIILGSSHMEATNVMQNENTSYILSERLKGDYSVYNMGISGHNFFKVCQYIPANLELYEEAPKLLIIETSTVELTSDQVNEVISSSVEYTPSHNTGLVGRLQKVPFFRVLYHQIESGLLQLFLPTSESVINQYQDNNEGIKDVSDGKILANVESVDETAGNTITADATIDTPAANGGIGVDNIAYKTLFSYLKSMEEKYDTQIMIVYHPTETLLADGNISFCSDEYSEAFTAYSNKYGISFVNMLNRFEGMYYTENHVPHGFCTGQIAVGHLNRYGHAAIADELYKEIIRLEGTGELCQ